LFGGSSLRRITVWKALWCSWCVRLLFQLLDVAGMAAERVRNWKEEDVYVWGWVKEHGGGQCQIGEQLPGKSSQAWRQSREQKGRICTHDLKLGTRPDLFRPGEQLRTVVTGSSFFSLGG
jgi:hypothetical protein